MAFLTRRWWTTPRIPGFTPSIYPTTTVTLPQTLESEPTYTENNPGFLVKAVAPNLLHLIDCNALKVPKLEIVRCSKPDWSPATVLYVDTPPNLRRTVARFSADQEFLKAFFRVVVFAIQDESPVNIDSLEPVLSEIQCDSVYIARGNIPQGPYFVQGQSLYRTWRLFPDIYDAFQLPTVHELDSDKFTGVTIMHAGQLMVPVPSRLHYPKTPEKPLNGVRVTVKDIIHLKGVKTTGQSRHYEKLYESRQITASVVIRLVELGATIIGKTKCTQFASSDQPTADWIDYHCPWNPRGDGYLSPRGSSTGTCVALAGYNWCDLGIGSDTGGSIRGPSGVMGLFAIRPTQVVENMHGILQIVKDIDTPGLVCRGAELLKDVSVHLFSPCKSPAGVTNSTGHTSTENMIYKSVRKPVRLLYPVDYWGQWPESPKKDCMQAAVRKLERYLGVEKVAIDLAALWQNTDPSKTGMSLASYLHDPFSTLLWKGYYDSLSPFRRDFEKKYGHPPYLHPTVQNYCNLGAMVSPQDIVTAQERKTIYSNWLRGVIFNGDDFGTIMAYPTGDINPFYRDVYRQDPREQPLSYNWNEREEHQASLSGIPDVVIPVGQVAQPSKLTGGEQHLPVAISLMSSAETDGDLVKVVWDLAREGYFSQEVGVGKHAF